LRSERIAPSKPTISLSTAIPELEDMFDGKYNQHVRLAYLVRPDDLAALVYGIQIQNLEENTWYEVFVDAHTGQLVSVTDFGAKAFSGTVSAFATVHSTSLCFLDTR
jgi:extracellular elastinolytic metalloproteinase